MFLTAGYINAVIGTASRIALAPNTAAFTTFEAIARAEVQAAAQVAGYSLGNTSTDSMVQWLTAGQWYVFAGALRKGLEPPPTLKEAIARLDDVREGRKPFPGQSPSTEDGIGGTKFSSSSESSSAGRVQVFARSKLRGW